MGLIFLTVVTATIDVRVLPELWLTLVTSARNFDILKTKWLCPERQSCSFTAEIAFFSDSVPVAQSSFTFARLPIGRLRTWRLKICHLFIKTKKSYTYG
jgi:hypothetical protein